MSTTYFQEPEKESARLDARVLNSIGDLYIVTGPEEVIKSKGNVVFALTTADRVIAFETINLQTDSPDTTYQYFEGGSVTHGNPIVPVSVNRIADNPVDITEMSNGATVTVEGTLLFQTKLYGTVGQGNRTEITGDSRSYQFLMKFKEVYYIRVINNHTSDAKYQFEFLISEYL